MIDNALRLDADGGSPRTIAPLDATSTALGWPTAGRAIVFLPKLPGCGSEWKPGLYLVTADGKERTPVAPAEPMEGRRSNPSITARDLVGLATDVPAP
jgi:hypothetical protein